ncbi:MAG TPA: tRNA (adenosine(37)-N6)-dimethylallyltransferase MiaA [Steroidobacteraceae bacterium]|nr:tRNA (adenosine(37)-N6)-dimethylallyltransferase MiaA [Steroidobacteraceae bacterium]
MSAVAATARLPVFMLAGPTGAGKSDWASRLAEVAPIEIVSVDSALVYRGLDVGSAKPSSALRARIPHHLIDICDAADSYSAGRFVTDALAAIRSIHARGRVPLLAGGTMLYFRALLHGLAPLPEASPLVRREIDERAAREGWAALHAELALRDPPAAARINSTDAQRIQRALEVCYATGRPISELQLRTVSPLADLQVCAWALVPSDRAVLHRHLEIRFLAMMKQGFLEEVRSLHRRGDLHARTPSMRAVGYRQLWAHVVGDYTLEEAISRGISATRQLAKRQLTWLRGEPAFVRLDPQQSHIQASWIGDARRSLRELGL